MKGKPLPWQIAQPSGTWVLVHEEETQYCLLSGPPGETEHRQVILHSAGHLAGFLATIKTYRIMDVLTGEEIRVARRLGWPDREAALYVSVPAAALPQQGPAGVLLVKVTERACRSMFAAEHAELLPSYGAKIVDFRVDPPPLPDDVLNVWRGHICETPPHAWRLAEEKSRCVDPICTVVQKAAGPRWESDGWCTANIPWNALGFMLYKLRRTSEDPPDQDTCG